MRLCITTHDFPTERQRYRGIPIWQTIERLRHQAEVTVVCPVPCFPGVDRLNNGATRIYNQLPASQIDSSLNFRIVPAKYFAVPRVTHSRSGEILLRKLRKTIAELQPDVILSYWIYPESYAAVRIGGELGVPVVVGSRGSDLKVREQSSAARHRIRYTLHNAAAVLTVSRDLAETAIGLGASPRNVHAVTNGVDSRIFRYTGQAELRRGLGLREGNRIVLFVGRLVRMKGIAQLVEAIANLNRIAPDSWELAIVGEGPEKSDLLSRIDSLGITGRIRLLGPLAPGEVARWMNAADWLCLPSESEGCPNVVQEALSCGCPVVATKVGGIPELVQAGRGVLIPNNSTSSIEEGLHRANEGQWDRKAIAAACHRSWELVAEETYRVCERVLQSSRLLGREKYASVGRCS